MTRYLDGVLFTFRETLARQGEGKAVPSRAYCSPSAGDDNGYRPVQVEGGASDPHPWLFPFDIGVFTGPKVGGVKTSERRPLFGDCTLPPATFGGLSGIDPSILAGAI